MSFLSKTNSSRSGSLKGSGRNIWAFTTLKMVAVAAMARPMVSTTAAVKSGALRMSRKEYATSWVIDIETSMRRTAGREFSKAITPSARHQATWRSSTSPCSHPRCQAEVLLSVTGYAFFPEADRGSEGGC